MLKYDNTVSSTVDGKPIYGAQVNVYDGTGTLASIYADAEGTTPASQPVLTDQLGYFSFYIPDGLYEVRVQTGAIEISRTNITMVDTLALKQRSILAAVNSAAPTLGNVNDGQYLKRVGGALVGADQSEVAGPQGPAGQGLADVMAPTGSALVGYKASGAGAANSTVAASVAAIGITAADFGIQFDGSDQSAKIQAAINAGHQYQKPVLLHGGLLGVGSTLDLKGRYVDIRGTGSSSTALVATAVMDRMFDIEEASDVIVSPFFLSGFRVECNHMAAKGIVVRLRHFTEMSGLYVLNATAAAIEEKDAWNNIRRNLTLHGSPIGLSLVGANHNSQWDKCSFATNTGVQLKIDNQGTANDGNMGLLFNACDVEFGSGKGITQASGCSSLFNGCYIGENIDQPVIENAGHMVIHGGVAFWGYTTNSYLVRPLGGRTIFDGVQLNGQTNGVPNTLVNLTNAETDAGTYGKVSFRDSVTYCPPQPAFYNGDVLAPILGHTYAPRYGQDFTAYGNGDTVVASSSSGSSKTMTITTPGASALAAMRCDLAGGWQKGQRIFYALTYQSSKPVRIKLAQTAFGTNQFIFDAPATTRISTVVIMSVTPDIATYPFIELQPLAISAGDTLTVHKQAFGDASFLNAGDSAFGNFGMIG